MNRRYMIMSSEKHISDKTFQITSRYYIMRIHWKDVCRCSVNCRLNASVVDRGGDCVTGGCVLRFTTPMADWQVPRVLPMLTADTTTGVAAAGCRGNAMNESVVPSNNNNNDNSVSESSLRDDRRPCTTEPSKQRTGLSCLNTFVPLFPAGSIGRAVFVRFLLGGGSEFRLATSDYSGHGGCQIGTVE